MIHYGCQTRTAEVQHTGCIEITGTTYRDGRQRWQSCVHQLFLSECVDEFFSDTGYVGKVKVVWIALSSLSLSTACCHLLTIAFMVSCCLFSNYWHFNLDFPLLYYFNTLHTEVLYFLNYACIFRVCIHNTKCNEESHPN